MVNKAACAKPPYILAAHQRRLRPLSLTSFPFSPFFPARLCKVPIKKSALLQQRHLPAIRNPQSQIRKSELTQTPKLTNDTEKPRPKDRGNPIVTVTIHRRRDCGLDMQGRSCRIPEVADQCNTSYGNCVIPGFPVFRPGFR